MSDPNFSLAREADIDELADQLRLLRHSSTWPHVSEVPDDPNCRGAVFLIGAGCSASAGIPLASDFAQECAVLLFQRIRWNGRPLPTASRCAKVTV